jgi:predicted ATPase/DNA-binding SARP family transcriptional activator
MRGSEPLPIRRQSAQPFSPVPPTATLRIHLLGAFRVLIDDRAVADVQWRLRKAKTLVKLLALAPDHWLHREELLEQLWPQLEPGAGANNLRHTLHVARRVLQQGRAMPPPFLSMVAEKVVLRTEGTLWIDVEAFTAAAGAARRTRAPAAYEQALALYSDDLLPEDRYEEWATGRREALREVYLGLLVEFAGLLEAGGEFGPAAAALERVIARDPTHEEAHGALMRLYALAGRQHQAVRQFRQLREALQRDLAREPSAASYRLHDDILAGRFVPPPPATANRSATGVWQHNLPLPLTELVGRERDVTEVRRLLVDAAAAAPGCRRRRLVTLTGMGGSGKTRLALAVAQALAPCFEDGVRLVELSSVAEAGGVPVAVAAAFNVHEEPGRPLVTTLTETLSGKRLLVVLDNCEHLIDACARLAEALLRACPSVQILATSREALRIGGEITWRVPLLPVPEILPGPALPAGHPQPDTVHLARNASVRLFLERARAVQPAFELTPANVGAVVEICRGLDGLPLALELAAAWVGVLTVEQLAARLDDVLSLLTGGSRTAMPRHQALRATLDWSYALLSPHEQQVLRRLAVLGGLFTIEAAEAVAGGGAPEGVLTVLAHLVAKSLVQVEVGGEEAQYRLLETVRQYALERLRACGDEAATRERCLAYLTELANPGMVNAALRRFPTAEQVRWLTTIDHAYGTMRTALIALRERRDAARGVQLATALTPYWFARGMFTAGRTWLEDFLALEGAEAAIRAEAMGAAAKLAYRQGDVAAARALAEEQLAIHSATADRAGMAAALHGLGFVSLEQADYAAARALFEESLRIGREVQDRSAEHALGLLSALEGDTATACTVLEEALAVSRELGDTWGMASRLNSLGFAHQQCAEYGAARSCYDEGLALRRSLGDRSGVAHSLRNLGSLDSLVGEPAAFRRYREALAIFRELADHCGIAQCLEGIAGLAAARWQSARALELLAAAGGLRARLGIPGAPVERSRRERAEALARSGLAAEEAAAALHEGRNMPLAAAVECAMGLTL